MIFSLFVIVAVSAVGAQVINCPGGRVSPQGRADAVSFHNILRGSIAQGRSAPGPRSASNMHALQYDCGLELQAQRHANTCPNQRAPEQQRPGQGQNIYRLRFPPSRVPERLAYRFAATVWWNQVINNGYAAGADNVYTAAVAATTIGQYAQMAWALTTRIGCGIANCRGFRSVVCNYMTRGPIVGQAMVMPGPGCTADADCGTFPGSTCDFALRICNVPAGTNPEPPVTQATTTTTVAPVPACTGSVLFDAAIRTNILNTHNTLRSNIARGQTIQNIVTRGCQNMFAMTYNCELEGTAQITADLCDAAANPAQAGRNVYMSAANEAPDVAATAALRGWQAEIAVPFVVNAPLANGGGAANQIAMVGQFASMAFEGAFEVGCGYARCTLNSVMVVCNYRAPRPGAGGQVYTAVTTNAGCTQNMCTQAQAGSTCNTTSGLCSRP